MEQIVIQINGGIMINVGVSVKNFMYVKKIMLGILLHAIVKIKNYLASIMDDLANMCDEIIESYVEETNFNEKEATYKTHNFYILLTFLLITITLLIIVSIYCNLIKYWEKQNHLLPFHFKNSKLKKNMY